jgi:hypothetical protein
MKESNVPNWIYGFLLLLVTFIAFAIYIFSLKNNKKKQLESVKTGVAKQPNSSSNYDPVLVWGNSTPATGATCKGYHFPHASYKKEEEACKFGSGNGANTFLASVGRTLNKKAIQSAVPASSIKEEFFINGSNGMNLNNLNPNNLTPNNLNPNNLYPNDNIGVASPAIVPTNFDKIVYYETTYPCTQSDTANIILMERTCNKVLKPGPGGSNINSLEDLYCIGQDGTKYYYRDTEQFYSYCSLTGSPINVSAPFCPGIVGGISVGFQYSLFKKDEDGKEENSLNLDVSFVPLFETTNDKDISLTVGNTDLSSTVGGKGNNLAITEEQFEIIRTQVFTDRPTNSNVEGGSGNNGVFAKIVHRKSGLCVKPNTNTASKNSKLILGSCDLNDGFVWALIPELKYIQKDINNKIYYDATCDEDKNVVLDDNGNPVVTPFEDLGPQQLVYVANAINPNSNINIKDPNKTAAYLQNPENNTYSLYRKTENNVSSIAFGPFQTLKTFINNGRPTTPCSLNDLACFERQCKDGIFPRPVTTNRTVYNAQISSMNLFNSVMASCKKQIIPF